MSATHLIKFIIGDPALTDRQAMGLLEQAMLSECEPLDYFSLILKIDEKVIYRRAAHWCGLVFNETIPQDVPANPEIARIDSLAHIKTIRAKLFDRDILFTSAGFNAMLRIREQVKVQPELAGKICIVPPRAIREGLTSRSAALLLDQARLRLARRWPYASAHLELGRVTRSIFAISLILLVMLAVLAPLYMYPVLLPFLAFVLLLPALFRLIAALSSLRAEPHPPVKPVSDEDLPIYTILIPLRDEANMVPQLSAAMKRLNYPVEKLDIKFVVESRSHPTIDAVRAHLSDSRFELIIVPDQMPRTKPKALNYALPMARGEFVVIYDAEDIPEPNQLRDAIAHFHEMPGLDCLQAELVIDNADENWLTALFSAEYSGLFMLVLPALARWKLPLPLGGTSNHFRLQSLLEVGGWDAFNVTEDADLGIRLSRLRYRTGTFTSRTYEEAPISIKEWLAQRTRWMKGWMQTFIVHNRHPVRFLQDIGWRNFLIFQAFVGGMIISAPLHSVFALVLVVRLAGGLDLGFTPTGFWSLWQIGILVIGYGSAAIVSILGLNKAHMGHLAPYQFLLPFYWILNSIAAVMAVIELFSRPYYWAKTKHGLTRYARGMDLK